MVKWLYAMPRLVYGGAERGGFNRVRGYKHMGVLLAMLEINTGDQTVVKTA